LELSVYVHVKQRKQIQINFYTEYENYDPLASTWNITVNQFDCRRSGKQSERLGGNSVKLKTTPSEWIASEECFQYFYEETGRVETFNFKTFRGGMIEDFGHYLGGLDYNICFRRNSYLEI
jgi:hypothetical protein